MNSCFKEFLRTCPLDGNLEKIPHPDFDVSSSGRFAPLPLGEGRVRAACAVQVFPAREDELAHPEVEVRRGRY